MELEKALWVQAASTIRPAEQIAKRLPPEHREPPPPDVLRPVVDHVAALTPSREVGRRVVGGVVVPMGGGEHHPRRSDDCEHIVDADGGVDDPPRPVAPGRGFRIPPSAVREAEHGLPMRAPAALAPVVSVNEVEIRGGVGAAIGQAA